VRRHGKTASLLRNVEALQTAQPGDGALQRVLARNVLFLAVGKALSGPITILRNAVIARFLGAEDYGYWFVSQTYAVFAAILITWGQTNTLPAGTARDRARASDLLGSGLVLRIGNVALVGAALAAGLAVTRPTNEFRLILVLVFVRTAVGCLTGAYQDVVRGFERTDVDALVNVLTPLLQTAIAVVVLMLGGRVPALVIAGMGISFCLLPIARRALASSGVHPTWSWKTVRTLARDGQAFLFFGLANSLQPVVDAAFLSRLTPPEVVGWQGVANRFVGSLLFPASAIGASLYPVLCRLHGEDPPAFRRTTAGALRAAVLLAVPLALGCLLFPDLVIRMFGRQSYGPAQDNLRVLSLDVFALYFTMPLGTALLAAAGRVRWALVQCLCVVVSILLDPPLIRWFQATRGNGGLGVCVSTVISEFLMVAGVLWLLPRGILNRASASALASSALSGLAMVAIAHFLRASPFVAAPVSLLGYVVCLRLTGAIRKGEIAAVRRIVGNRIAR
jgi:O-antigen/teichoic acid export membrane protein